MHTLLLHTTDWPLLLPNTIHPYFIHAFCLMGQLYGEMDTEQCGDIDFDAFLMGIGQIKRALVELDELSLTFKALTMRYHITIT